VLRAQFRHLPILMLKQSDLGSQRGGFLPLQ
jgi:hypothetical protein